MVKRVSECGNTCGQMRAYDSYYQIHKKNYDIPNKTSTRTMIAIGTLFLLFPCACLESNFTFVFYIELHKSSPSLDMQILSHIVITTGLLTLDAIMTF